MTTFKQDTKIFNSIAKCKVKCTCGHSIPTTKPKVICSWCGNYVYKDKRLEFKEKLKKVGK